MPLAIREVEIKTKLRHISPQGEYMAVLKKQLLMWIQCEEILIDCWWKCQLE